MSGSPTSTPRRSGEFGTVEKIWHKLNTFLFLPLKNNSHCAAIEQTLLQLKVEKVIV